MFKLNFINNFLGRNQVPYKENCKKKEIPIITGAGYNRKRNFMLREIPYEEEIPYEMI